MPILVAYGTIEGQTGKIASFAANIARQEGEDVVLLDTASTDPEPPLDQISKVILAASVHERRHPKLFEAYLIANRDALKAKPTLLLSVSLKAAFDDGLEEAQDFADEMKLRTGLEPDVERLIAGAIRPETYDNYAAQVLRHNILDGKPFDPTVKDHEFTNWDTVADTVSAFVKKKALT